MGNFNVDHQASLCAFKNVYMQWHNHILGKRVKHVTVDWDEKIIYLKYHNLNTM